MNKERYIARATNVAARMIGGEVMIMSGLDSSLFSLNATASVLWQAADGVTPLSPSSSSAFALRFEVNLPQRCATRKNWPRRSRATASFGCPIPAP
jgi:hypothetical protein